MLVADQHSSYKCFRLLLLLREGI